MKQPNSIPTHPFNRINAIYRLLICLVLGLLACFLIPVEAPVSVKLGLHFLAGWDIFALSMLAMSWIIFYSCESTQIRKEVKEQDASRFMSFLIVLVAAVSSLTTVLFLLRNDTIRGNAFYLVICIGGMALSWFLVHTIFAFRYGHLYYGDNEEKPDTHAAGLEFPEELAPDYLDFAYFSFVIGMTFQVSDVEISSRRLRHLVLFHGIISFLFNTVVLALSISVIGVK